MKASREQPGADHRSLDSACEGGTYAGDAETGCGRGTNARARSLAASVATAADVVAPCGSAAAHHARAVAAVAAVPSMTPDHARLDAAKRSVPGPRAPIQSPDRTTKTKIRAAGSSRDGAAGVGGEKVDEKETDESRAATATT